MYADGNMPPPYPDTNDGHPHIGYSPNGYPPHEGSPLETQVCITQALLDCHCAKSYYTESS